MKRAVLALAALALLCGGVGQAKAGFIIYSNFGPGDSYSSGGYSVSGGFSGGSGPPPGFGHAIAEAFTPTDNFLFGSVELPLVWFTEGGEDTNAFTVDLMSDAGGHPGTILEQFSLSPAPLYTSPAIDSFTSTTHTPLDEGTSYWIVAVPVAGDTAGFWLANTTGATGFSRTGNDGVTWSVDTEPSPALEVDGTQVVPEPSTLALAAVGAVALAAWRWRWRR